MDKLQELLIITMEECGELIQECSKAIRTNKYKNNGSLQEEIGDVLCMIELIKDNKLITGRELKNQVELKKLKLMKWSNLLD